MVQTEQTVRSQYRVTHSFYSVCYDYKGDRRGRRDRDSNPGYLAVYTLSKRAPSATRPSLRGIAGLFESNTVGPARRRCPLASAPQGACAVTFCFTIADDFKSTATPCIR